MAKRRNLNPDKPEQFLLIDTIIELTGRSRASIYRWVKAGTFPAPYKIGGGGSIAWKRSDYNEWTKQLQKVQYS